MTYSDNSPLRTRHAGTMILQTGRSAKVNADVRGLHKRMRFVLHNTLRMFSANHTKSELNRN